MKTVYIPTGTEVSHMNLATGHLVVDGSLTITGTLKAKTIGGRGFVEAGTVSADGIQVDDLKAVSGCAPSGRRRPRSSRRRALTCPVSWARTG